MTDLKALPTVWESHEDDDETGLPVWLETLDTHEWCSMVPDGTDTNGDEWYRCVVHDKLALDGAYVCEGYVPEPYGEDADEPSLVMLAPARGDSRLYGWYPDVNPAFLFDHDTLATVLTMSPNAAHAWLLDKVSDDARRRGCPWYV